MELTLVGLQYSGKTTFVNVIAVSNMYKKLFIVTKFRHNLLVISLFGCFTMYENNTPNLLASLAPYMYLN